MVDNSIAVGSKVVPVKAGSTTYPGRVVKVHEDGALDICWRGTRDSIQRGANPKRMQVYVGRLPLYGPNRSH